jgi:predicted house-cleaning noncanonical NTP pyrophosphatase (MazG superfamily)
MVDNDIEVQVKNLSDNEELINYFKEKIIEEAEEVYCAKSKDEIIEELADCLEVIRGFAQAIGENFDSVESVRSSKHTENGGFYNNIVVDTVSLKPVGELKKFYEYYVRNPEKYPEIEEE